MHSMWRVLYVTYIKCDVPSIRRTFDVTDIQYGVHSIWRTFNMVYIRCDVNSMWRAFQCDVHSMWRAFNVTCIQCDVDWCDVHSIWRTYSIWRTFNVTYMKFVLNFVCSNFVYSSLCVLHIQFDVHSMWRTWNLYSTLCGQTSCTRVCVSDSVYWSLVYSCFKCDVHLMRRASWCHEFYVTCIWF